MNYLQQSLDWYMHLPTKRKLSLACSLGLILMTTLFISWFTLSPSYAVLFNQLDEKDASQIISQLEQDKISYQLRNDGRDILIDKPLIPKQRLKIMSANAQLSGSVGFELFDKNDFGMTDFSQKINYQRALQGELERTISSLEEVRQARVHLMIPEKHLFEKDNTHPRAAVTLHLQNALSPNQVLSIQKLLAASVAHLSIKRVVVVDQNGNTLSKSQEDSIASHLATKKSIEHYLNEKVTHMLQPIFSTDQVRVKIDASLNYDVLQRELVTPHSSGIILHEKESKNSSVSTKEKNQNTEITAREKSYQLGSKKELFKRANGTLDHLSISVLVPENTSEQKKSQIQRLVKATVGFNPARGDSISIEALLVKPQSLKPPVQFVPVVPKPILTRSEIRFILLLLLFFTATTSVLFRRIRQKKKQLLLVELKQWLTEHDY